MEIKKINKSLVIAVVVLAVITLFRTCSSDNIDGYETITVIHRDTVTDHVTHIDTVKFSIYDTVRTTVEIPIPYYDTIEKLNKYTIPYNDSLISGRYNISVDGVLVNHDFIYIPKFPRIINRTDSIFTTITNNITTTKYINDRSLYLGGYIGVGTNSMGFTPTAVFKDKKNNLFSYGYSFDSKQHQIGYMKKIKFK